MSEEIKEPAVEEALKELRELLPRRLVYLERNDYFAIGRQDGDIIHPKVKLTVPEAEYKFGPPLVIETYTLRDAMAQLRKWKESQ